MLDRFDAAARRAVDLAAVEAQRLGHPYVGTEHVMLGLLAEGRNPAAMLLQAAGAPLSACREKVREALARRDLPAPPRDAAELELTDRAARAIDRAGKLSLRLKSEQVEAVHLLTSVLDVEGTAGQVLRGLNVDLTVLRDQLAGVTTNHDDLPAVADEDEEVADVAPANLVIQRPRAEPVCAACGALLSSALSHTVLTAGDGIDFDVVYCSSCGAGLGASRRS
ncbi:MAG TPA: Clp protease N-terminal domain-containing protein [Acidimicrobiales bacterium]|nr:Clp protease N-terminal domain-containing protein [Acidimicrobiales bacterium]